jgi:hypothetical protein
MTRRASDHGLEFLLGFDGRIHHLEKGYWLKFEIARVTATTNRPHGLSYSFTLHAPDGTRLVGFDNAHDVPARRLTVQAPQREYRSLASHGEGCRQTLRVQRR